MTKRAPFRYFKTSPEIIHLAVILYPLWLTIPAIFASRPPTCASLQTCLVWHAVIFSRYLERFRIYSIFAGYYLGARIQFNWTSLTAKDMLSPHSYGVSMSGSREEIEKIERAVGLAISHILQKGCDDIFKPPSFAKSPETDVISQHEKDFKKKHTKTPLSFYKLLI